MKRYAFVLILNLVPFLVLSNPVQSCVGRLLVIAVSNSTDQDIMGQMLATLINERTGTTVDIVRPGDVGKCHETVMNGEANIYINYIGMAWAGAGGSGQVDDPQKVYTLVAQRYKEEYAMIWLKPFGFQGPLVFKANGRKDHVSLAVPVATKDVLKKFPVLDRVINKLASRIDNNTMEELRKKAEREDVEQVVQQFLQSEKLI
jgi:glycine betaine/choline ABC-type transport system substrate-binding protein